MQQQISESSKERQVALVAVSADSEDRGESILPDESLGSTGWHNKAQRKVASMAQAQQEQEDSRAAGRDSDYVFGIPTLE